MPFSGARPARRWDDRAQGTRPRFASGGGSLGFFLPESASAVAMDPPQQQGTGVWPAATASGPRAPGDAPADSPALHRERAARLLDQIAALHRDAAFGQAILNRLDTALVAANPDAEVRYANLAAADYLASGKALCLSAGRLATPLLSRQTALATAVRNAGRFGATAELTVEDVSGRHRCWILVMPLLPGDAAHHNEDRLALLLLHDPDAPGTSPCGFLRETFGVTAAESRLAEALVHGVTAEEFAAGARLSMNTVRTHIRSLLTKTGVNRQADLLRLLARLPRLRNSRPQP